MLKGVTKRIVEIKSPASGYFERAVLYLRADKPYPKKGEAVSAAYGGGIVAEPRGGACCARGGIASLHKNLIHILAVIPEKRAFQIAASVL